MTAVSLTELLAQAAAPMLCDTLSQWWAGQPPSQVPQDHSQASYAHKIHKSEFALNWANTHKDLHNQIRAFHPMCWTKLSSKDSRVKILQTALTESKESDHFDGLVCGGLMLVNRQLWVKCGDQKPLIIVKLQKGGKGIVSGYDFMQGLRGAGYLDSSGTACFELSVTKV